MSDQENEAETQTVTRQRGTTPFPYADLDDAIDVVRAIWETGGTHSRLDAITARVGHQTTTSGAFRNKVGAARLFGLVRTEGQDITLTPLGERIIDPSKAAAARAEAFLNIPLFKKIHDNHQGGLLPGPGPLEQEMAELGAAPNQTERARQIFQRAAEQAGFYNAGRDRLVAPLGRTAVPDGGTITEDVVETPEPDVTAGKPAVIEALFRMLPGDGQPFPEDKREKWKQALAVNLDLAYADQAQPGVKPSSSVPSQPSERSQNGAGESEPQP